MHCSISEQSISFMLRPVGIRFLPFRIFSMSALPNELLPLFSMVMFMPEHTALFFSIGRMTRANIIYAPSRVATTIKNIFFNKAPLHDGAVIIDDGKISAAGCLLPNTRRNDIDSDLGTRHRAAIGMSEISDAIIIVVSEETGTISVAYDCTLTRNYSSDSLRKFLIQKLIKSGNDYREDK